jgi:hypothetical protein
MSLSHGASPLADPPLGSWPPELQLPLASLLATRLLAQIPQPMRRKGPAQRGAQRRQPGLNFRELRPYQAGDEVRHIDWRVTARLGRPVTRLYEEEQEQHHWLLLNLSPALYFGSRERLKAQLACELAAALLWRGERHPQTLHIHGATPQTLACKGSPLPLLPAICLHYQAGLGRRPLSTTLAQALERLRPRLPHGARLTIISDHLPPPPGQELQLRLIARRHDIHYWQIRDPLEAELGGTERLPVMSPLGPGWLDGSNPQFVRRYRHQAQQQLALSQARLLPLVQRLTLLDSGLSLQAQWPSL